MVADTAVTSDVSSNGHLTGTRNKKHKIGCAYLTRISVGTHLGKAERAIDAKYNSIFSFKNANLVALCNGCSIELLDCLIPVRSEQQITVFVAKANERIKASRSEEEKQLTFENLKHA